MKKPILFFVIFLGSFLVFSSKVQASVFVARLYYIPAQQILKFDKDYPEKVLLDNQKIISVFDFSDESKSGKYTAELYDNNETILISGTFDAKAGAFSLEVPYVSIAERLKIIDKSSGKEILSADLAKFITCNRNGVCEFETGETAISCLIDCATSNPAYSQKTTDLLKQSQGIIKDANTGAVLLTNPSLIQDRKIGITDNVRTQKGSIFLVAVLIFIIIAVLGYFIYKKFIKKQ